MLSKAATGLPLAQAGSSSTNSARLMRAASLSSSSSTQLFGSALSQALRPASLNRPLQQRVTAVADTKRKTNGKAKPVPMELIRVQQQKEEAETEILRKIAYQVGVDAETVTAQQAYQGVAWTVRERLIDAFNKTQAYWRSVCLPFGLLSEFLARIVVPELAPRATRRS